MFNVLGWIIRIIGEKGRNLVYIYKKKIFFFKIKFDCLYFFLNKIFLLKINNILIEMCDFNFFKR